MEQRSGPANAAPPSSHDALWVQKMSANSGKALRWTSRQQDMERGRLRCMIPLSPRWFDFFFRLNVLLPTEYLVATPSCVCTRPLMVLSVRALAAP
jgi:hypothetical protein